MRRCLCVTTLLLMVAVPASAQYRPERPYRGLFGGGLGETEQRLTASASVGTGWDSNVVADALGFDTGAPVVSLDRSFRGALTQATGGLSYVLSRSRYEFFANGGVAASYYPTMGAVVRRQHADVRGRARATQWLSVSGFAQYSPFHLMSVFPAGFETTSAGAALLRSDLAASTEHFFSYGAGASAERNLSRKTRLTADYGHQVLTYSQQAAGFRSHTAGARLTHSLRSDVGVRGGYQYSTGRYGLNRRSRYHLIDVGVDYAKALSFSRRTRLAFSTGTAASANQGDVEGTHFHAIGSAGLLREIGRTWSALLAYQRGVYFAPEWQEAVMVDAASFSVGGLLNRRAELNMSVGASDGHIGVTGAGPRYRSYYGVSSFGYALSRFMNASVTYGYYNHVFGGEALPSPGFPRNLSRHSARAQVSMWAPLYQKGRRR